MKIQENESTEPSLTQMILTPLKKITTVMQADIEGIPH